MPSAIRLSQIYKSFGEVNAVDGVDLEIAHGEFFAMLGPSGSGKSSLLYLLGLLDIPTEGDVFVGGKPTKSLDENHRADLRLAMLGFVFQFHYLFIILDFSSQFYIFSFTNHCYVRLMLCFSFAKA